MASLVLFGSFVVFLLLSVPIGIALGLSTMTTIFVTDAIPLPFLMKELVTSMDSFPIMAVPFFILAGEIMGKGGISERLFNFANALVGNRTGGFAMATIVTCMFFAAISGSGPATVAAIGGIMIPAMVKQGYDKKFATAVVAAAGSIGVIIPPSIPMVIYGVVGGASIDKMFMAGIFPGVLVGLALMTWAYIYSKKHNYRGTEKTTVKKLLTSFWDAKWALLTPVIILGGIYGGYFTPTEAAVVAVVYGLIAGMFMYRELKVSHIPKLLIDSAIATDLGYDPIHFGIIMVVNLAIGFITPPLGVNLFVGSGISGLSIEQLSKAVLPFFIAMLISLSIVIFIPEVSLWLANIGD